MSDPLAQRLADAYVDRRRLKRRLTFWRTIAIIAVVGAFVLFAGRHSEYAPESISPSHIARVHIDGIIDDNPELIDHLHGLAESSRVVAVLVHIDSPGGTFSGSEALYTALRHLSDAKPTAAVIGGMAASGGYMAAIAADHIVARAGSVTGSIGVIFHMPRVHRLLDDLGIEMEVTRSGPLKARPSPAEPPSEQGKAATEALVADLFDQFLEMVTARRELTGDSIETVRSGGVFTGRRALDLGLVDAVGGEAEARDWLIDYHDIDSEIEIVSRPVKEFPDWLEDASSDLRTFFGLSRGQILDGPWAVWHQ